MLPEDKISHAIKILRAGGVVAFPTETVFGIGALLSQPRAIKKIFKLKNRPLSKPLQILVASLEQAQILGIFNDQALKLAKKYWPGPLTLVVQKKKIVPKLVTGGTIKVGLRVPNHRTILELIKKCGPIVATSANIAGAQPALTAKEAKAIITVDYVLPGKVRIGKASKVIDSTADIRIIRS